MSDKPRQPELEGKTFKEKDGKLSQGQINILLPDPDNNANTIYTLIWYKDGKIHGRPAIIYYDGLEEEWHDGKFVSVYRLPFHLRD
jgi:hypothetical protein